jgi:transcriptional regulator
MAMYNPDSFRVDDPEQMQALVREHPLATLVMQGGDGPDATHVPLLLMPDDGRWMLRGHVARANPAWRHAGEDGCPALAVFHGPQAYVSPGWYPTKKDDPRVVPTWNYAVVHAHGTLRAIDDPAWLHDLVTALTDDRESARPEPWAVSDAPIDYIEKMLRAVVGLELVVERLEGKWKMSQNRAEVDRDGVVTGLRAEGGDEGARIAGLIAGARNASGND